MKVKNWKEMAKEYGVDYRTLQDQVYEYSELNEELESNGFNSRQFYPIHQEIVWEYLGNPNK